MIDTLSIQEYVRNGKAAACARTSSDTYTDTSVGLCQILLRSEDDMEMQTVRDYPAGCVQSVPFGHGAKRLRQTERYLGSNPEVHSIAEWQLLFINISILIQILFYVLNFPISKSEVVILRHQSKFLNNIFISRTNSLLEKRWNPGQRGVSRMGMMFLMLRWQRHPHRCLMNGDPVCLWDY